jgi:predicted PilT family ATPase
MSKFQESLQQHRKIVEQLKVEANMERIPVSEAIEEMKKFCELHYEGDVLINGFTKQNENPFKDKGGCIVL